MSTTPPSMSPQQLRERAIELARAGQPAAARELLHEALRHAPNDELTLLWLAQVSPYHGERIHALEQALAVNPGNHQAQQHLAALRGAPAGPAYAVPGVWQATPRRQPGCLTALATLFILGALLIGVLMGLALLGRGDDGGLALNTSRFAGQDARMMYVGLGVLAIMVVLALLGGVGLLLGRRWGWSCAILPLAWMLASAMLMYSDLARESEPYDLGYATPRFVALGLVALVPLVYLHRDPVTRYVGVTPRYRTIFTPTALIASVVLGIVVRVMLEL